MPHPQWKRRERNYYLYLLITLNAFTHAIELIRFALYDQFNIKTHGYTLAALIVYLGAAGYTCDAVPGMMYCKSEFGC